MSRPHAQVTLCVACDRYGPRVGLVYLPPPPPRAPEPGSSPGRTGVRPVPAKLYVALSRVEEGSNMVLVEAVDQRRVLYVNTHPGMAGRRASIP